MYSPTFWFQPLYRWIAGLLHLVFGDSSVGEYYWDGACLLTGALAAFLSTSSGLLTDRQAAKKGSMESRPRYGLTVKASPSGGASPRGSR